jgi:hypothetical protein
MVFLLLLTGPMAAAHSQSAAPSRTGPRPLLDRAQEIALARSAAPAHVSDSAAVYVLADSAYVEAVPGSNGVACYVSRSWPGSLEPHCFDQEGATTVMRIQMRRTELLHRGVSDGEADRRIGADLAAGRLRLPRRPAMSYMMSAAQVLVNDAGRATGRWQPHLMIYYPYLSQADLGLGSPDPKTAMVAGPGTATSSILVVMREFIEPVSVAGAAGRR